MPKKPRNQEQEDGQQQGQMLNAVWGAPLRNFLHLDNHITNSTSGSGNINCSSGAKARVQAVPGRLWPRVDVLTSPQVENLVRHSLLSGAPVATHTIMCRQDGLPLCCHLHCTPLAQAPAQAVAEAGQQANLVGVAQGAENAAAAADPAGRGAKQTGALSPNLRFLPHQANSRVDTSGRVWAVLTVLRSSQVGCAAKYGYGFGFGDKKEYFLGLSMRETFKMNCESTETKCV